MVVRTSAKVLKVEDISPSVYNLHLKPEQKIPFKAGQYVMLQLPIDDKPVRRSYSIASKEDEDEIMLCIKRVGEGKVSPIIHKLKPGDEVNLIGPVGHFVLRETDNEQLFIATGTGIAPFRSMIAASKQKKTLLFGARKEEDIVFKEEFENTKDLDFYYCTSREKSNGFEGRVQQNLPKILEGKDLEKIDCYICGLKDMVLETVAKLEELGIPRHNIYFERYD